MADEAYRSLEPLRRLPELMQAAVPVTPEVLLGPDRALVSAAGAQAGGTGAVPLATGRAGAVLHACGAVSAHPCPALPSTPPPPPLLQPSLSEEGLRLLLGEQLGAATRQLAAQQEQLLEEIRSQPQVCNAQD